MNRNSSNTIAVVISLLGVQFVVVLAEILPDKTSRHASLQTQLWHDSIILAQSYTSVQFCPQRCLRVPVHLLVYIPSLREPKLSGAAFPRGTALLVAPPEGGWVGGGGAAALVALVDGKETGAYFLWKWGYHFPNYYCNYWRRPCLGRWPMGMQMGRHQGQIQKSYVIRLSSPKQIFAFIIFLMSLLDFNPNNQLKKYGSSSTS